MFILAILGPFLLVSWSIVFWIAEVAGQRMTCELARYYILDIALYNFAMILCI